MHYSSPNPTASTPPTASRASQVESYAPTSYITIRRLSLRILPLTPSDSMAPLILNTDEKAYLERNLSRSERRAELFKRVMKSRPSKAKMEMESLQRHLERDTSAIKFLEILLADEESAATRRGAFIDYLDTCVLVSQSRRDMMRIFIQDFETNDAIGAISVATEGFESLRAFSNSEDEASSTIRRTLLQQLADFDGVSDTFTEKLIKASGLPKETDRSLLQAEAKALAASRARFEVGEREYIEWRAVQSDDTNTAGLFSCSMQ